MKRIILAFAASMLYGSLQDDSQLKEIYSGQYVTFLFASGNRTEVQKLMHDLMYMWRRGEDLDQYPEVYKEYKKVDCFITKLGNDIVCSKYICVDVLTYMPDLVV